MSKKKAPEVSIFDACDEFGVVIYNGFFTDDEVKKIIPSMEYDGQKIVGVYEYAYLKYKILSEEDLACMDEEYEPPVRGRFVGYQYIHSHFPGQTPKPIIGPHRKLTMLESE